MKFIAILLAALLAIAAAAPAVEKRLIQVGEEDEPQWLTQEEIFLLIKLGVGFMDITETQDLHVGPVPKVAMAFPTAPTHQSVVNPLFNGIVHQRYIDDLTYFSQNFFTRYYRSTTGVASADWLFGKVKEAAALGSSNRTTVTQFAHSGYDQKSIIATLQGKNPNGPVVVIGAHQDSINSASPASGRSPGADDNGSGSISVLEIYRTLVAANFVPELTIEFQWYAAEEVGLLGSQAIAQSYKNAGKSVYAMFNLDMTAYTEPGLQVKVLFDYTNEELATFTSTVVDEYTSLTWRRHTCGYGCSDHASYDRAGYPSSSIFEPKTNPQIHTARDDLNLVNWPQTLEFIRLGLAVIVELSYGA